MQRGSARPLSPRVAHTSSLMLHGQWPRWCWAGSRHRSPGLLSPWSLLSGDGLSQQVPESSPRRGRARAMDGYPDVRSVGAPAGRVPRNPRGRMSRVLRPHVQGPEAAHPGSRGLSSGAVSLWLYPPGTFACASASWPLPSHQGPTLVASCDTSYLTKSPGPSQSHWGRGLARVTLGERGSVRCIMYPHKPPSSSVASERPHRGPLWVVSFLARGLDGAFLVLLLPL